MPTNGLSGGDIAKDELAELAKLFDASEFAFDPLSDAAKEAKSEFENKVVLLFEQKIRPKYPKLLYAHLRLRIRSACRAYLRSNEPCLPQDLPPSQKPPDINPSP